MEPIRVIVRAAAIAALACLLPMSVFADSGEATRTKPLSITLEGPAKVPVAVSVERDPKAKAAPATLWFDVYQDGKGLKRLKTVPGKAARLDLDVPAGQHVFEFRLGDPAASKASFTWTAPAAATSAPAAANAPSAASAEPVPAGAAAAPARDSARRAGGFAWEAGLLAYTRFSAKRYEPAAPGFFAVAWRPMGEAFSIGGGVGLRHMSGERTEADYEDRVLPPYVLTVDVVPIEARARWSRAFSGNALRLDVGAGFELARSSYENAADVPRRTVENDWAPTVSAGAGLGRAMGGGSVGIGAGVRFARHAFAAHDFDLLHGVEVTAGYARGF